MQNKILLTIIPAICFVLLSQMSYGQNVIFNENFKDNSNNWQIAEDESVILKIDSNSYFFECKSPDQARDTYLSIRLDTLEDFTIETIVHKTGGINTNGFGIILGKYNESPDSINEYNFLISGNGQVNVIELKSGELTEVLQWTENEAINRFTDNSNRLTIIKKCNTLKFKVNGTEVTRVPFNREYTTKMGYVINQNIAIRIDNLAITADKTENICDSTAINLEIENPRFYEPSNNGALDRMEQGEIRFDLHNKGQIARDIKISLIPLVSDADLIYNQTYTIEEIMADETKKVAIAITAGSVVPTSEQSFLIQVSEISDFYACNNTINFPTITSLQNQFTEENTEEENDVFDDASDECIESCVSGCFDMFIEILIEGICGD